MRVGGEKFGKAEVDCRLYGSESKWGVIESDNVGIIYFGLTLSQNSEYRLDWIDIRMCFKADEPTTGKGPEVTQYIAPQVLWGPEREEQTDYSFTINPNVQVAGTGGSAGEISRRVGYKRIQRWSFCGEVLADETSSDL